MARISEIIDMINYYRLDEEESSNIDSQVEDLEKRLNIVLPRDYKQFLTEYGPIAIIDEVKIKVLEENPVGEYVGVEILFHFSSIAEYDLNTLIFDTYGGRIPDETIPVGQDSLGNLFLLSISGGHFNKVWFWDHEHREISEPKMKQMIQELNSNGISTQSMDIGEIIWRWERLPASQLTKGIGYGNVYLVSPTFSKFIQNLEID